MEKKNGERKALQVTEHPYWSHVGRGAPQGESPLWLVLRLMISDVRYQAGVPVR